MNNPKTEAAVYALNVLSPFWLPVISATFAGLINSFVTPLPKGVLAYLFVVLPCIAAFFMGNLAVIRSTKASGLGMMIFAFIIYSLAAIFVLFFVGWWALMHLHL